MINSVVIFSFPSNLSIELLPAEEYSPSRPLLFTNYTLLFCFSVSEYVASSHLADLGASRTREDPKATAVTTKQGGCLCEKESKEKSFHNLVTFNVKNETWSRVLKWTTQVESLREKLKIPK